MILKDRISPFLPSFSSETHTFVPTISKSISMIKLILFVAALLPLPVFGMNADEKDAKKIPLQIRQSERLGRGLLEIPIEATYYGMFSSIQTVVISRLGKVEMVVTNCDTGEYWYDSMETHAKWCD